ncbi:MAG: hypothetical protein P1T08_10770 [Acidimicrobiia bacterium]|nr:hypothetical protein [Acidimicrobiia bacterium]
MPGTSSTAIVTSEGWTHDRSALATVRALARAGRTAIVAVSGPGSLAAGSRFTSETVSVVPPSDPGFAEAVRNLATDRAATTVFPTSDIALVSLVPATARLMDKSTLTAGIIAAGLTTPPTRTFASAAELDLVGRELGFPLIVKPRTKSPGGPVSVRVDHAIDLMAVPVGVGVAQPYLNGVTRALAGVAWNGRIVARLQQRYIRTFPSAAGTASFAITEAIDPNRFGLLEALLGDFDGIFQAQFVGEALIDLNLRPYGSMALALAAGLNLPDLVCRLTEGEDVATQTAAVGVRYRWIDGDLRSLLSEIRAGDRTIFSAWREAMPHRGVCHSIVSVCDPLPAFIRLRRQTGVGE